MAASFFFVGCTCDHVPPYPMLGLSAERLVIRRTPGNAVDGVIDDVRAALARGVEHFVVCGHEGCEHCGSAEDNARAQAHRLHDELGPDAPVVHAWVHDAHGALQDLEAVA